MPSWQIIEFVNYCLAIAAGPYYYSQAEPRCDPIHAGHTDCSGLIVAAANHVGTPLACTNSWAIARTCHQERTSISPAQARATLGALAFIGFDEGQSGGSTDKGHIVVSLGNGEVVEAANHRAGILVRGFDGRGWNYTAMPPRSWFPWTASGPVPTPAPPVQEDLLTTIAVAPIGHAYPGTVPTARPVPPLGIVILEGGGRLEGDRPGGGGRHHLWRPSSVPASAKLIDIFDMRPEENAIGALYDFGNHETHTYRATILAPGTP